MCTCTLTLSLFPWLAVPLVVLYSSSEATQHCSGAPHYYSTCAAAAAMYGKGVAWLGISEQSGEEAEYRAQSSMLYGTGHYFSDGASLMVIPRMYFSDK